MSVQEFIRKMKHESDYAAVGLHPYAFQGLQQGAKLNGETPVDHVTKLVAPITSRKRELRSITARGELRRSFGSLRLVGSKGASSHGRQQPSSSGTRNPKGAA